MATITNILSLPLIDGTQTSFLVPNNADWVDTMYFGAAGALPQTTITGCSCVAGSNTVTVPVIPGTVNIGPSMTVSGAPGLPSGGLVGSVPTPTTFTLVDQFGNAVLATATNVELSLTFTPPPMNLTGIGFIATLRLTAGSSQVWLTAQTGDSTMINGGSTGMLSFNVPRKKLLGVRPATYVMDMIAADTQNVINLMAKGPATVTVIAGISDALLLTGIRIPT